MKPGDKVRFIHTKGEGIVRKIIDPKNVEVEIEDGFVIPFIKSDLVVVSSDETRLSEGATTLSPSFTLKTNSGDLWFAFVPFNDKIYSSYLVNDSSEEILFTFHQNDSGKISGIAAGTIKPNNSFKVTEVSISSFEEWPEWILNILTYSEGHTTLKAPLTKSFKFKANSFFKNKQNVPVLQKDGYVFKIERGSIKINAGELKESMLTIGTEASAKIQRPASEIDLHIEKLRNDFANLSNSEILKTQLQTFETNLENAIATGMEEIIFIHGVGNGVLRNELHKILSKNKAIKFFQDARKEKFGFGATLVRIK